MILTSREVFITIETKTTQEVISRLYDVRKSCGGTTYYSSMQIAALKHIQSYTKESRPKPKPLTNTPRPLIYKMRKESAFLQRSNESAFFLWPCTLGSSQLIGDQDSYSFLYDPAPILAVDMSLVNYQIVQALNSLRPTISGSVAEIDQVYNMIRSWTLFILRVSLCFVNPFSKGCARYIKSLVKKYGNLASVPAAVLEVQFGLRPFCGDLASIANGIHGDPKRVIVKKVYITQNDEFEKEFQKLVYKSKRSTLSKATICVSFKNTSPVVDVGNPLEWAWERIPFSFVVDWVIDVSTTFMSLETLAQVESYSCTLGTHYEVSTSISAILNPDWTLPYKGRATAVGYERKLLGLPYVPFPHLSKEPSTLRWLNIIATLGVILSGK